jgi:prepilin-type N-terminal cleavage/methylation domain-containing protein
MTRRRDAFTLIELLVVIAIIALLISLMLPALGKARDTAKATKCAASLYSMSTALSGYLNDGKGYFPADHREVGPSWVTWVPRLRGYLGGNNYAFDCASVRAEFKWKPRYGFTAGFNYDPKRYGYVAEEVPHTGGAGPGEPLPFFSYGYNGWGVETSGFPHAGPHLGLGGHAMPLEPALSNPGINEKRHSEVRDDKLKVPSDMITIADSITDGTWDTWITWAGPTMAGTNTTGDRHFKGSQVMFADAHVKWFKRTELNANTDEAKRRWNNHNRPGANPYP